MEKQLESLQGDAPPFNFACFEIFRDVAKVGTFKSDVSESQARDFSFEEGEFSHHKVRTTHRVNEMVY